ncbi:MAG: hypothetical protein K0R83_172 [Caulobacter sp.]|jgi:hypothetical protein|nr:hypothetical protein [Caulobacter sp.]
MRLSFAAAAATAGVLAIATPAPALAADQVVTARKCGVRISNRLGGGNRNCQEVLIRRDVANARAALIFDFDDGFHLELDGLSLSLTPYAFSISPDRVVWANPGQNGQQVETNAGADKPVVRGHCVIKNHRRSDVVAVVNCDVSAPVGRIIVAFVAPKPE